VPAAEFKRVLIVYTSAEAAQDLGAAKIFRDAMASIWNSMKDELKREMHFSLDFLLEEPYI
jgi:hypothetical protein